MSSGDALTAGDVAAIWEVKLPDGSHRVVFEHGTTSGKRVIFVDDKEVSSRTSYGMGTPSISETVISEILHNN